MNEYWRQREEQAQREYKLTEEEYIEQLNGIYDYMLDRINEDIRSFYSRYASREGITYAEATERVSNTVIEEYERKAKKYVEEHDFSAQANREMRIYNLTMRVNRLETLKAEIGLEMVDGFDELDKVLGEDLTERAVQEMARQSGILGMTVKDTARTANSIVGASFHNATFSERIWMYQDELKSQLDILLRQGLIQGRGPRELADQILKRFDVSRNEAERLMRTELCRVQTEAQKQSFIANGFDEYQFNALGTACPICLALDEQHFKIADMQVGENASPLHPNCRCSISAYIDDALYNEWLDTYQNHGISYEDWLESRPTAMEKESSKPQYDYADTVIEKGTISSPEYRRRIDNISNNTEVNRSIWESAQEILEHRSGTRYEDLAFVDSKSGKYKINKSYSVESRASMNKTLRKMLNEAEPYSIIAIHNHPGSSAPSFADIQVCAQRKYKCGVVVCHDGGIYKYSVDERKFNEVNAAFGLDRLNTYGYNEKVDELLKDAGIDMEVL